MSSTVMNSALLSFSEVFYANVASSQSDSFRNTCMSPYSIYSALATTLCGCDGDTKCELIKCLHMPNDSEMSKSGADELANMVSCQKGVEIAIANRMFLESSSQIKESFINEVRKLFSSEPKKMNFRTQSEAARSEINEWARKATSDKIVELFPRGTIDSDTRVVLGNAVYFKGAWETPFNPSMTIDHDFHVLGGGTRKVKMMKRSGHIHFVEGLVHDAMAIKLPFVDTRFELLVMLPQSNDGFATFVNTISQKGELEKILNEPFYDQPVNMMLPRFKLSMTPTLDVKKTLEKMGISTLFRNANMKKISDEPLCVSDVVHQAVLEVNEAGATAAAATGVGIMNRSLLPPNVFTADHAFVVAVIVDKKVPLFMGHVIVPEE